MTKIFNQKQVKQNTKGLKMNLDLHNSQKEARLKGRKYIIGNKYFVLDLISDQPSQLKE